MAQNQSIAQNDRRAQVATIFRYTVLILLLLGLVLPFLGFIINSLAFRWFYPQLIPNEWSLDAWDSVLNDNLFEA
ncbi:MAG: hypothetical protein ACPG7F_12315, partial [Aggregatilineales bacterium]